MTPTFRIVADGADITALINDRLLLLRTTDKPGMESDDFELRIDDRDSAVSLPSRGANIEVFLGYSGTALTRLGRYTVDEVVSSPDGKYVFVQDLGADKVFAYHYDPKANHELPLTPADPASVQLPPGSGPRHLLFSADGKHAWLTTEMSAQVAVFDYNDGTLTQTQLVDFAAGQPVSDKAGAALHASSDGKFLYVSNRGTANQLLVFSIDPATGMSLEALQLAANQWSIRTKRFMEISLGRAFLRGWE